MLEFQGKTFEWDGWRFNVRGNLIAAWPVGMPRVPGTDLEFHFQDDRDDMVIRRVHQIMAAVNAGAYIKAWQTRQVLGVANEYEFNHRTDMVWRGIEQPRWLIQGAHGYAYKDFEERVT